MKALVCITLKDPRSGATASADAVFSATGKLPSTLELGELLRQEVTSHPDAPAGIEKWDIDSIVTAPR